MNTPIEHQIIRDQEGNPLFAVIPWDEYEAAFGGRPDDAVSIPLAVAEAILDGASPARAWREYLHLTQAEVAERMGISRPALAQMERPGAKLRRSTMEKLAAALGIEWEQLRGA